MTTNCPCGTESTYEKCCGPFIEGKEKPGSAEKLMRSRYTAFTKVDMDYLTETTHPKTRGETDPKANKRWAESSDWQGLEILGTENGQSGDQDGRVEFIAHYTQDDESHTHHEVGVFKFVKDRWLFVEGKHPVNRDRIERAPKVGRNDPCTCGSGKKFKKCCGAN